MAEPQISKSRDKRINRSPILRDILAAIFNGLIAVVHVLAPSWFAMDADRFAHRILISESVVFKGYSVVFRGI